MAEQRWHTDPWGAIYLTDGYKVIGYVYNDGPNNWRSVLSFGKSPQRHETETQARERVEEEARRGD